MRRPDFGHFKSTIFVLPILSIYLKGCKQSLQKTKFILLKKCWVV